MLSFAEMESSANELSLAAYVCTCLSSLTLSQLNVRSWPGAARNWRTRPHVYTVR